MKLIAYLIVTAFILLVIYLKMAFWGTVIMSAAKPIAGSCGVQWKLEKLPLFTGQWFCPEEK